MKATAPMFIHYVRDMERAVAFYSNVFDARLASTSPGWSSFEFDGFELALHMLFGEQTEEAPLPHAGLALLVNSIEEAQARIEANGGQLLELREPNEFVPVRVASFRDTEGNGFDLRQAP